MIRHILLFSFRDDAVPDARQAMLDEFAAFPAHFPQMRDWQMGANASERDQTFSHAMTVRFDSAAELDRYLHSEKHELFVERRFKPLIARRAIATFVAGD